tara:strand:- start:544 stop:1623 length:1080 start_codon:yes stop_codon:yes gene_type:complete
VFVKLERTYQTQIQMPDLTSNEFLLSLIYIVVAIIIGFVLHFIVKMAIHRVRFLKDKHEAKTVVSKISAPLRWLLILASVYVVFPKLGFSDPVVKHIIQLILIGNIGWLIVRIIRVTKLVVMTRYDLEASDNLEARKAYTQFHIIENILVFVTIILCVGIMLMTFEGVRQIGISLLTSAGIAGIILGFAAQRLIATILAGIQIAITQPIRIDDVVIVEEEWGRIEEINLTFVVINIWDQRRLVVPTTYFIEKPFQNWTRTTSQILGTVFIETDYHVPFNAVRDELTRLLKGTDLWDGRVNVMQVTEAKEKTVEMRILVSASSSPVAWDLRVYIREKMIEFIRENYPDSLPVSRVEIKSK